jgi:hypothetical protein
MLSKYLTVVYWRAPDAFPALKRKADELSKQWLDKADEHFFPLVKHYLFGRPRRVVEVPEVPPDEPEEQEKPKKPSKKYISDMVFDRAYRLPDGTVVGVRGEAEYHMLPADIPHVTLGVDQTAAEAMQELTHRYSHARYEPSEDGANRIVGQYLDAIEGKILGLYTTPFYALQRLNGPLLASLDHRGALLGLSQMDDSIAVQVMTQALENAQPRFDELKDQLPEIVPGVNRQVSYILGMSNLIDWIFTSRLTHPILDAKLQRINERLRSILGRTDQMSSVDLDKFLKGGDTPLDDQRVVALASAVKFFEVQIDADISQQLRADGVAHYGNHDAQIEHALDYIINAFKKHVGHVHNNPLIASLVLNMEQTMRHIYTGNTPVVSPYNVAADFGARRRPLHVLDEVDEKGAPVAELDEAAADLGDPDAEPYEAAAADFGADPGEVDEKGDPDADLERSLPVRDDLYYISFYEKRPESQGPTLLGYANYPANFAQVRGHPERGHPERGRPESWSISFHVEPSKIYGYVFARLHNGDNFTFNLPGDPRYGLRLMPGSKSAKLTRIGADFTKFTMDEDNLVWKSPETNTLTAKAKRVPRPPVQVSGGNGHSEVDYFDAHRDVISHHFPKKAADAHRVTKEAKGVVRQLTLDHREKSGYFTDYMTQHQRDALLVRYKKEAVDKYGSWLVRLVQ